MNCAFRVAIAFEAEEVLQRVLGRRRLLTAGVILPELEDVLD
jgi:hypothetical protein